MIRKGLCGVITAACVLLAALPAAGQEGERTRSEAQVTEGGYRPVDLDGRYPPVDPDHRLVARVLEQAGRSGALPEFQPPSPPGQRGPTLQWISIVLLSGEMDPDPAAADDIPPAVRRALTDVQSFLPFKSYRLVDVALLGPPTGIPSSARLSRTVYTNGRVAAVQTLRASVMVMGGAANRAVTSGPLTLSFELTELGGGQERTQLMGTTVTLDVGETVVVGTSRIGGTALIALLTAVPATR